MNTAPLPAFIVPTASAATAAGDASVGSTKTGDNDAFSRLLSNESSPSALSGNDSTPDTASEDSIVAAEDTALIDDRADTDQEEVVDAPWPPAGLETLLTPVPLATTASAPPLTAQLPTTPSAGSTLALPAGRQPSLQPATSATTSSAVPPAGGQTGLPAGMLSALMPADGLAEAVPNISETAVLAKLGTAMVEEAPTDLSARFAAMMTSAAPLSSATSTTSTAALTPVPLDMQGAQPEQAVSESIEWMLDQKLQSARIQIHPEKLGMIEVEVRMDGERVHTHFTSMHAEVRQVLNDSLPRLRELLDSHGLQLGDTGVGAQARQQPGDAPVSGQGSSLADGQTTGDSNGGQTAPIRIARGLLDTYA